jgi:hypothetical protein
MCNETAAQDEELHLGPVTRRLQRSGDLQRLLQLVEDCELTPVHFRTIFRELEDVLDPAITLINKGLLRRATGLDMLVTPKSCYLNINTNEWRKARLKALKEKLRGTRASLFGNLIQVDWIDEEHILSWEPEEAAGLKSGPYATLRCQPVTSGRRLAIEMSTLKTGSAGIDALIEFLLCGFYVNQRHIFITKPQYLDGPYCRDWVEFMWVHPHRVSLVRGKDGYLKDILGRADLLAQCFPH